MDVRELYHSLEPAQDVEAKVWVEPFIDPYPLGRGTFWSGKTLSCVPLLLLPDEKIGLAKPIRGRDERRFSVLREGWAVARFMERAGWVMASMPETRHDRRGTATMTVLMGHTGRLFKVVIRESVSGIERLECAYFGGAATLTGNNAAEYAALLVLERYLSEGRDLNLPNESD